MGVFIGEDEALTITFWYHGYLPGVEGAENAYEGPLRARLRLGEELTVYYGGPTDEGWSRTEEVFRFVEDDDGDMFLMVERSTESRDCDGRLDTFQRNKAVELAVCSDLYDAEVLYPMWERMKLRRGEYAQRDYTAEAMGY